MFLFAGIRVGLWQNICTVRIVGVTKAQQALQNWLGWKPIIISMSSQNLCRPAGWQKKYERGKNECKKEKEKRIVAPR